MTFAFDLDGTISAYPAQMGEFMQSLRQGGHRVIVLTGCITSGPTSLEQRRDQLLELSTPIQRATHYDELIVVSGVSNDDVAKEKGIVCRDLGVAFMLDDTRDWLPIIRAVSPSTIGLWVCT